MHITFAPRGILQIDDARITWKNFAGVAKQYNREGERNFALIIDDQKWADALVNDVSKDGVGWNVKSRPPREEGEEPFIYMNVKVKFSNYGPNVYLKTGDRINKLDEESIACLDSIRIAKVDLDIRPYDNIVSGKPYRSAYLQSICVTQDVDRFADRFADYGDPADEANDDDLPWN